VVSFGSVKVEKDALNLLDDFIADVIHKIKQDSATIAKSKELDTISSEEVNQAISNYFVSNSLVPSDIFLKTSDREKSFFSAIDERGQLFEKYLCCEPKEWVRMGVLNNVEGFYCGIPNFPDYICSKGVGFINFSIATIMEYIFDPNNLAEWDYFCEGGDLLEIIDEYTTINHFKYRSNVFVFSQARDFLIVRHRYKKDDSMIIFACSIEDSQYPPFSQYTRGDILFGGFLLEPHVKDGQTGTMLTYISCVDIKKPSMPNFVLTKTIKKIREKQPQTVHLIRKNIAKLY